MRRIRWRVAAVALILATLAAGCGGRGDRGKNQDFDRPKQPDKQAEKK